MHCIMARALVLWTVLGGATAGVAQPGVAEFFSGESGEGDFSPAITKGATDQVLGRVMVSYHTGVDGANVTHFDLKLGTAARTGLSNLKMWSDSDQMLPGASQFGSTIGADPGNDSVVTFNGSAQMTIGNSYWFFFTADVASDATGGVTPVVDNFGVDGGATITNFSGQEAMSNELSIQLPVSLTSWSLE